MAERHLAGEAEQDVEADRDHRGQRERRHDEHVVAVRHRREDEYADECGGEESNIHTVAVHTFFASARPNRPCGMSASATITSAKLRICVYADPSNAVMSDSVTPNSSPA